MAKEKDAYYFSHDGNARNDPKIGAMRCEYGSEGYGWYWMLVEMMREQTGYRLDMQSKYAYRAMALQLQCQADAVKKFVQDCINEFQLFESDGSFFWSNSLVRRMEKKEEKSEIYSKNARKRWEKSGSDTTAMQSQSNGNALKESKVKESKEKEIINNTTTSTMGVNPFLFYENERFGFLSSTIGDKIGAMIDQYGETWVLKAMEEAVVYNQKHLPYVKKVLGTWENSGHPEPWTIEKPKPKQAGSQTRNQKPVIPIVQNPITPALGLSDEEKAKMQEVINKLGGKTKL